jgi:hypothetical protein
MRPESGARLARRDRVGMLIPLTITFWRHFQGAACRAANQGLKPLAESCCPFGADDLSLSVDAYAGTLDPGPPGLLARGSTL